ncbi:peptidylprolyl isomerase [Aquabacterium sp.]|uniref:peptidylprolyl isomerase n=1 Tax=Aquabacterium sp. TaxID=1872578 RepID=UPI0035B26790
MNSLLRAALVSGLMAFSALASAQTVKIATSMGDIVVKLDAEKAPKTVANFMAYTKANFYNGTIFHRVIDGFMIQGGGFTTDMRQKPTNAPIPLESRNGLSNKRGTIAMARTSDPNSATAQFFINVKDNAFLDQPNAGDGEGYAVFGQVIKGMDVVDKIKQVATVKPGDVPVTPIVIKQVSVEK